MKKTLVIVCALLLLGVIIIFSLSIISPQKDTYVFEDLPRPPGQGNAPASETHAPAAPDAANPIQGEMSVEDRLVAELKKYYGTTIANKSTQAILLKVRDYILSLYPEDGEARFYSILKRAFPELADEIMVTLKKLDQYNRWLKENELLLAEMNELERKGTLWEKRRELFGDDADEIWSEEVFAYEERQQTMKDTIRLLDESYDTTIAEKLDIYLDSLNETYKDSPEAYFLENRGLLAKVFFGIESVQKELKEMTPDLRQAEINKIRREMGYTQTQIEEQEKMDAYRNSRWENGLKYMADRDALVNQYQGPELEEKLKSLREEYFKHEAKTIMLEENDGFFRYQRPRVYGRN